MKLILDNRIHRTLPISNPDATPPNMINIVDDTTGYKVYVVIVEGQNSISITDKTGNETTIPCPNIFTAPQSGTNIPAILNQNCQFDMHKLIPTVDLIVELQQNLCDIAIAELQINSYLSQADPLTPINTVQYKPAGGTMVELAAPDGGVKVPPRMG